MFQWVKRSQVRLRRPDYEHDAGWIESQATICALGILEWDQSDLNLGRKLKLEVVHRSLGVRRYWNFLEVTVCFSGSWLSSSMLDASLGKSHQHQGCPFLTAISYLYAYVHAQKPPVLPDKGQLQCTPSRYRISCFFGLGQSGRGW